MKLKKFAALSLALSLFFAICGCADEAMSVAETAETTSVISDIITTTPTEVLVSENETLSGTTASIESTSIVEDEFSPYELDLDKLPDRIKSLEDYKNIDLQLSELPKDALIVLKKGYVLIEANYSAQMVLTEGYNTTFNENGLFFCGFSYDSYFDYLHSVFTDDLYNALLLNCDYIININGEACVDSNTAVGSDPLYISGNYSIEKNTNKEIEIMYKALFSDAYTDEIHTNYYNIKLIRQNNNWYINEFEFWR